MTISSKCSKWYQGCYRVTSEQSEVFGQIKKVGKEWQAEIRTKKSGDLRQYAGNWNTLAEARAECESVLCRHPAMVV